MINALRHNRQGSVSILTALAGVMIIGGAAFGIDIGMMTLSQRQLQGVADQAAMAAMASSPNRRAQAVGQILAANGVSDASSTMTLGTYRADPAVAPEARFAAGADGDAIRVTLRRPVPLVFGRILTGTASKPVAASAIARRMDYAAFSLGSRLVNVEGGLPGALLNGLAGTDLSLSLFDYQALVGAKIDLLKAIPLLGTRIGLTGASFDTILAADVTLPVLLTAMADTTGDAGAAAVLRRIALRVPGSKVPLTRLIDLGPLGTLTKAHSRDSVWVDVYEMLRESLSVSNGRRQVALDLGGSIPGLASTKVMLSIGERPVTTPWLAVARDGTMTVRTAQQRMLLETQIGTPLLASVQLPIFVETAAAQARLNSVTCSGTTPSVTIDTLPSPGTLAIAQIDRARFDDMQQSPIAGPATLLQVPLARVTGQAQVNLASDSAWQRVSFAGTDIANGTVKSVTANSAVRGIASSLINRVDLRLEPLGFGVGLNGLTGIVGAALTPVAPALDTLIGNLTDLMGLHVGQADITVDGARCGAAALVA
ncbi:pilus assembly protein TadG-related protein [Sphingomonas sanguinis]|uniref:TadG family pilus assembly protein n=1 Tax=Sphingomonas sp. LC-1 TaxID=3110957 RepID=UPI0021BB0A3A|nr:TadG family pilus assembly protein [Sphingomonas sp. LC-1]MCT8002353.1 pilus assembly protein TadG-related protein [Sphingomonas sp. LC-1]